MKRIILTGATGFIGANLARRLVQEGHDVHLIVRPGHDSWRIEDILSRVTPHITDLAEKADLEPVIVRIRPDWIFHLAAHGAYSWQKDMEQMIRSNLLGTINLVEACLKTGFEAFIHTGTSSEYGFKPHAPAENEWLEPNSPYAFTKASASQFCRYMGQSRGVHLVILRLYSVFGPYEEPGRLIPTLIREGLAGRLPPLARPEAAHDFVFIDDVLDAYLLAATVSGQKPGAIYNVGSGHQTSLRQVVDIARQALCIAQEPSWETMPGRIWDTVTWYADSRRIRAELGWDPKTSFGEGFDKTVAWFRENPGCLSRRV